MNYNEFKEVLRNEVQKYFETDVQLTTKRKLNNVILDGLTIVPKYAESTRDSVKTTPVEPIRTPSASTDRYLAAASAVSLQYPKPSAPVHALAMPEFTITACAFLPLSTTWRSHFTGAAFTTLVVNVPAASHGT